MASFKDTRDLIVLSYDMNLINDDDFLLLYSSYSSQNLDLPYDSYPQAKMNAWQNFDSRKQILGDITQA